jgi:hypothetical protein
MSSCFPFCRYSVSIYYDYINLPNKDLWHIALGKIAGYSSLREDVLWLSNAVLLFAVPACAHWRLGAMS